MLHEEEQITARQPVTGKTLLVVEDDLDNREFFELALVSLTSHRILSADSPAAALRLISHSKPDLFLIEYRLPDMNGLALYDQLHAIPGLEDVPALLINAGLSDEVKHEAEQRKLVMLEKPFDLDDFLHVIHRMLGQPPPVAMPER
jgi:CheY-like chemotaxis protein